MNSIKTLIIGAGIAVASFAAAAQTTVVAEYDYNRVAANNTHSGYVAAGVAQTTKYGTFDGYWQGVRFVDNAGKSVDNYNGFEFGYGNTVKLGPVDVNSRIAYGTMAGINVGNYDAVGKYLLASAEVNKKLTNTFAGYAGYSYMHGLNTYSIHGANRVQFGVDTTITPNFSLRTGASFTRQQQTNLNGVVVIGSYTL